MLYQLGSVQFDVAPMNAHEIEAVSGFDFAAKDVIGAHRPREATGEADRKVSLRGKLFPRRFGGLSALDALTDLARGGVQQMLIRGDGTVLGWHFVERVRERSSYLDADGVGRVIEVDIELVYSPDAPAAAALFSMLQSLF